MKVVVIESMMIVYFFVLMFWVCNFFWFILVVLCVFFVVLFFIVVVILFGVFLLVNDIFVDLWIWICFNSLFVWVNLFFVLLLKLYWVFFDNVEFDLVGIDILFIFKVLWRFLEMWRFLLLVLGMFILNFFGEGVILFVIKVILVVVVGLLFFLLGGKVILL